MLTVLYGARRDACRASRLQTTLPTVLLADLRRLNRLLGRDSKPHVDYDVREIVYGGAWRDLRSMITETFDASVIEAIPNIYSSLSFVCRGYREFDTLKDLKDARNLGTPEC